MKPHRTIKEVHILTRRVGTLNHFISRAIDNCAPFFQVLHGKSNFSWDQICEKAFDELKGFLSSL